MPFFVMENCKKGQCIVVMQNVLTVPFMICSLELRSDTQEKHGKCR
jgi:hypothetical protein